MSRVLVDTSVWRRFFAGSRAALPLKLLLDEPDRVATHPFVTGS